jgi:hypothetical protein
MVYILYLMNTNGKHFLILAAKINGGKNLPG